MAINKKTTVAGYQTYPGRTVESTVDNTNLLPGVHRTTRNKKYIDALLGELTSKGTLESFDGWIGSKNSQLQRKTDIYLNNNSRYNNGIKSTNVTGDLVDIREEMTNRENVALKDAKQLTSKSYGYAPGIDPDKFVNFQNYYWLRFDLPEIALEAGFNETSGSAEVTIDLDIVGKAYYTTNVQANGQKLTLRNGMKVYFIQRDHGTWTDSAEYITEPSDSLDPKYFVVAGVGSAIKLLPYDLYQNPSSPISILSPVPWDKKNWDRTRWDTDILTPGGKQYVTIKTGSHNYNVWSRTNRWIHEQTALEVARFLGIETTLVLEKDDRASRPIIEFEPQIDLWNHGNLGKRSVSVLTTNVSSLADIEGLINPVIDGVELEENARVIFAGGDPAIRNKTFVATNVNVGVTFVAAVDAFPVTGETVVVNQGTESGFSYWFNGEAWVKAQQLTQRGQAPLFRLFDGNGDPIELSDVAAFSGSKIFGYETGTTYDRELNFSIAYDSSYKGSLSNNIGAITFRNYLAEIYQTTSGETLKDISSFNYYRAWNIYDDSEAPIWHYRSGWQPISEVFNVKKEHSLTVVDSQINAQGNLVLTGNRWKFNPTYTWNISTPAELLNENNREFLLEELPQTGPAREWYDELVVSKFTDNKIYNYTGQRLRIANQRGIVFVDTTDIEIDLPASLFEEKTSYTPEDCYPNDYVIRWKIGNFRWNTARLIARRRDDPRRPNIFLNGTQLTTNDWRVMYAGGLDAFNTAVTGLQINSVTAGDKIDVVVNGSMSTTVDETTEISNLSYNPYNEIVTTGAYGQFFGHFVSAISKRIIPRFVPDANHLGTQEPRFSDTEGYNYVFGDNDWQFSQSRARYPAGHKIVLHNSPAVRFMWASRSGEVGETFTMLEDARKSYANFKLKFIQKIERLYLDQDISDIQASVDKALSDIFVGRNDSFRYAHSHMVMWGTPDAEKTYTFLGSTAEIELDGDDADPGTVTVIIDGDDANPAGPMTTVDGGLSGSFVDYACEIPGNVELGEISSDHVYVYYKNYNDTAWRILTYTKDYEIDHTAKTVHISAEFDTPCQFKICVFDKTRTSYVPPTPAKMGIMPWYHPEIYTDTSYQGPDVLFIQGHDGSLTPAWGDFRDDMLLEFERRVASSIGKERGERAELLMAKHWPRKMRQTWYNRYELNQYLEDAWLTWANENNIVDMPNAGHVVDRPLTYNYSAFVAADGNTYGSWRDIYRHVYGTDRVDTHPWEMLNFARKPAWWDSLYSWSDTAKRNALISALAIGNRSDQTFPRDNKSYLHHDLEYLSGPTAPFMPVNTDGSLRNPIQAGWYDLSQVNSNIESTQSDWLFGGLGPYELAWRRSSDYSFAAAAWLILSGGPEYMEAVWEGPRLANSLLESWIDVDRDQKKLVKWANANQHRETSTDVVPGYGMLLTEQAASLSNDVLSELIGEIRNIRSCMQWTALGFVDNASLDFVADILIEQEKGNRIPAENYQVNLKVTSPSLVIAYSGVKVIADESGGYQIQGYDNISTYFSYYPVDTTGPSIPVELGSITYKKYTTFENTLSFLDYGTVLETRQDVINFLLGYGEYLKTQGWVFEDTAPTLDDILDWSYSAREFATWSQTRWQPNTQLSLSPASENLVLEHNARFFGRLDTTFLSRTYLLDSNSRRIDFKDTEIIRENNQTVIKSRPGVGIYFVRCGLEEYTHVVTFDDVTIFNDQINDYLFGISIKRLRAQGRRTKNWNGRPKGNGYIVQDSTVRVNLDTISRELGDDYITVENRSSNPWIRNLKKSQLGLNRPENAFLATGFSKDTIDQFQAASLRRKGTPNIIDKFTKGLLGDVSDKQLAYDPGITVRENWMFRMGEDYGYSGSKKTWEIKLPPNSRETLLDRLTIRVIPPFRQNTYYETQNDIRNDNIVDLLGPNDRRWVRYPADFELPLRDKAVQETDLPQAGIADRLESTFKFMDIDQLYDVDPDTSELTPFAGPGSWQSAWQVATWVSTQAYDQEDYVRYKGQLYRAVRSHVAQAAFDPALWDAINEPILPSIWVANKTAESSDIRDWTMLQTMDKNLGIREICAGTYEEPYKILVEMEAGVKHMAQAGDWVLILSTTKTDLNGFYPVQSVRDTESFFVELKFNPTDYTPPEFAPGKTSPGGKLFLVKETHFYTIDEMKATLLDPSYEWADGMKAYIDDRVNEPLVYEYRGNYALFDANNSVLDNRSVVFYDMTNLNFLHMFNAQTEENMPWLFSLGMLLAAFNKLNSEELLLTDTCTISLDALAVPGARVLPSNVPTVTVANAIRGIVFRQANDCAYVLAEKIYGDITSAVSAVKTLFENSTAFVSTVGEDTRGSGTPLDLAYIATAIWAFADYRYFFAEQTWFYRGKIYESRNKLLDYNGIGLVMPVNLDSNGNPEYHTIGIKSYSGRQLLMVATGYSSRSQRDADSIALIDTVNAFGSASGVFNQVPFVLDRALGDIVDHSQITNVEIVDYENNTVLATLSPYDPAAGILPSYVDSFINWKEHEDPASYTNSDLDDQDGYSVRPRFAWFDEHKGEVWWDLSTVRYYDYYQGNSRERSFNWGRQFPGSKIDVYEWVKSVVPPAEWAESVRTGFLVDFESVSGTPYHKVVDDEKKYFWCERSEKDASGVFRTYYYFWVSGLDRTYTARTNIRASVTQSTSKSQQVYSRTTAGIPASTNKFTVTQIASVINDPRVTGSTWFAGLQKNAIMLNGVANLLSNKGAVLRIETNGSTDTHNQWLLLKENDVTSEISDWLHIRLRDSIIGSDQTETLYNVTNYQNNQGYSRAQVVRYNNNYYRAFRDFLTSDVQFADGSPVPFASQPWQRMWNFTQTSVDTISEIQGKDVPDYNRHPYNRYGNEIRPSQQSWLNDRIEAIRIFVDAANRELAKVNVTGIINWDKRLTKVITTNDSAFSYDVSAYWNYIDFVDSAFDATKPITATLTSLTELYNNTTAVVGDYVKVLVGTEQIVNIWEKSNEGWVLVFQQNGTIQINKELFDLAKAQDLWDASPWDSIRWDHYPFVELFEIITALREDVFVGTYQVHYNVVFFALVREVMRQNPTCHWIRKSSYVDVERVSANSLSAAPYFRKENLRNDDNVLVDFVNEVKPYHTKILNQIEVDQLTDKSNLSFEENRTMKIVMNYNRHGDQTWQGYYIDGHRFGELEQGWDRNPWEFEFTAEGLLPATGERVSRMKNYLWDMDQPRYDALIDTIIAGHSFGVQPEALQAIVDGNAFYQPEWDRWPEEMVALSPGESVEIRVINNQSGSTVNANTIAWRYHYDILGGTTVYRYNNSAQTTVATAASTVATEIELVDASVLTRPDPVNGKPGIVWLARERIEFWEIDGNTIKRLVRGTLGTPVLEQTVGRKVYDGGQQNQVPTPGNLKNWHDSLYPQWNELGQTILNSDTREAVFLKEGPGYFVPG